MITFFCLKKQKNFQISTIEKFYSNIIEDIQAKLQNAFHMYRAINDFYGKFLIKKHVISY